MSDQLSEKSILFIFIRKALNEKEWHKLQPIYSQGLCQLPL